MLDQQLNRVSMYRLLSITLTCLWGFATLLTLIGLLPYSPVAMIASATVLVASSYGFNVLFGWLFSVKTHDESSFITAMILFFLFIPSADLAGLSALALVAMIAMGSKYVLAVRGRHIFNPAAIGAVIIGLLGVTYATWWIATPVLTPVTLLFAFLILYKTRRLKLGLVFLTTAIPLIILVALVNGQSLSSAITSIPSWPLLFLVGFMLSEPLTLPARKWQRYVISAVVAILFTVPFDIGILSSTPAFALVIGNLVGFLLTQRRHLALVFKERIQLSDSTEEYTFTTKQPINYIPGQYMEMTIPHAHKDGRGVRRIFSIVGTPDESTIRFGIKMYDRPSSFKTALHDLKPGTIVTATGIGGDFILPKDTTTPLLLIAGGIGITPFISHLLYLRKKNVATDITLIYFVSTIKDLVYANTIKTSGIRVIVVTTDKNSLPDPNWILHSAQRIAVHDITKYIPDITTRSVFISGPPQMVDDMKHTVKQLHAKHITCDYFTGY
ncbi:MAG: oxidoreductase [Candidatus Saccharibacteria bacterium]|nr:oxidoreductase [Candidatus Saccharibacteria bacterium]